MSGKLTNVQQLRDTALEARGLIAKVAGSAAVAIEALDNSKQEKVNGKQGQVIGFNAAGEAVPQGISDLGGPWLPLNGSSAMRGDLRLGTNRVFFGDDAYLCDGDLEIVDEGVDSPEVVEPVEPEEAAPLSAEDVEESVEGEIVDSEEVEEEGDAEGEAQPIQYMKLASAITGEYVPLSVGAPVRTSDAATKGYVDGLVGDIGAILDQINGEVA